MVLGVLAAGNSTLCGGRRREVVLQDFTPTRILMPPVNVARLLQVTGPTEGLEVGQVQARAAGVKGPDVVNFQPPGTAAIPTPPTVPLQGQSPNPLPCAVADSMVVLAQKWNRLNSIDSVPLLTP